MARKVSKPSSLRSEYGSPQTIVRYRRCWRRLVSIQKVRATQSAPSRWVSPAFDDGREVRPVMVGRNAPFARNSGALA